MLLDLQMFPVFNPSLQHVGQPAHVIYSTTEMTLESEEYDWVGIGSL